MLVRNNASECAGSKYPDRQIPAACMNCPESCTQGRLYEHKASDRKKVAGKQSIKEVRAVRTFTVRTYFFGECQLEFGLAQGAGISYYFLFGI